jgi:hypothetical protein
MKLSSKLIIACFASICTLYGDGYVAKQLNAYKMHCKICHGPAFKGAAMQTSDEWELLFKNNKEKLNQLHTKDKDAIRVLESERFDKDAPNLLKFLKANSSDSGVVRSCDGLNCG